MRPITAIALDITTVCNLRCAECCCGVGQRERLATHYDWEYFKALAPFVYGINRIDITGGEPTAHPRFSEYVPNFRKLFGCALLTLETNGYLVQHHAEALRCFDFIRCSRYPENGLEIDWLLANYPAYVQNGATCVEVGATPDERKHLPRSRRGSGRSCHLGSCEFVAYTEGKFWPCRLGPAVDGAVGIEPCEGWVEKVLALPMPCANCCFSPGA